MFGIFKKPQWREVIIHNVVVGEVLVDSDEDELMKTIEQVSNELFERSEARYKDTSELYRLLGELRCEVELFWKEYQETKPKTAKKPAKKVVKTQTLKPVAKKKVK